MVTGLSSMFIAVLLVSLACAEDSAPRGGRVLSVSGATEDGVNGRYLSAFASPAAARSPSPSPDAANAAGVAPTFVSECGRFEVAHNKELGAWVLRQRRHGAKRDLYRAVSRMPLSTPPETGWLSAEDSTRAEDLSTGADVNIDARAVVADALVLASTSPLIVAEIVSVLVRGSGHSEADGQL